MTPKKSTGGRPAKFAEPSRPVTVTLPERILRQLDIIGPDRAQAIARLVDAAVPNEETRPRVEVAKTGSHTGLIVVGPSQRLKKIPFLQLVEIAPSGSCSLLNAATTSARWNSRSATCWMKLNPYVT